MKDTNEIIEYLNHARRKNKVSINEISKNMFYHRNTISKILNHRRKNVSMDFLFKIANTIGCDIKVFINND